MLQCDGRWQLQWEQVEGSSSIFSVMGRPHCWLRVQEPRGEAGPQDQDSSFWMEREEVGLGWLLGAGWTWGEPRIQEPSTWGDVCLPLRSTA